MLLFMGGFRGFRKNGIHGLLGNVISWPNMNPQLRICPVRYFWKAGFREKYSTFQGILIYTYTIFQSNRIGFQSRKVFHHLVACCGQPRLLFQYALIIILAGHLRCRKEIMLSRRRWKGPTVVLFASEKKCDSDIFDAPKKRFCFVATTSSFFADGAANDNWRIRGRFRRAEKEKKKKKEDVTPPHARTNMSKSQKWIPFYCDNSWHAYYYTIFALGKRQNNFKCAWNILA